MAERENELLFILKQQLEIHDALAEQVSKCDRQIQAHLETIEQKVDPEVTPMPAPRRPRKLPNRKHIPQYDLRKYLYQITGVDLTQIYGIGEQIELTVD